MNEMVSVIISTHNRCESLRIILDSILKSDYRNLEIIVVDNASTDETEKEAALFGGNSPFAVYPHVITCYYVISALQFGRPDLAWNYLKGAWNGCFCRKYSAE